MYGGLLPPALRFALRVPHQDNGVDTKSVCQSFEDVEINPTGACLDARDRRLRNTRLPGQFCLRPSLRLAQLLKRNSDRRHRATNHLPNLYRTI